MPRRAQGYVFIKMPDHPNAGKSGYVREHVLVMSAQLGRAIAAHEVVHHINGIRDDNRPDNLELMTPQSHAVLHHKGVRKPKSIENLRRMTTRWAKEIWASGARDHLRAKPRVCDQCGAEFLKERLAGTGRPTHLHQFCNRRCFQDYRLAHPAVR